jgi:predicted nucleic acid-binding protein
MKLLLDTNVFLEILLEQAQAAEARSLLSRGG